MNVSLESKRRVERHFIPGSTLETELATSNTVKMEQGAGEQKSMSQEGNN